MALLRKDFSTKTRSRLRDGGRSPRPDGGRFAEGAKKNKVMYDLDRLVQAVRRSSKYRNVCEEVIRNVGSRELATRGNWKEAVKATKNKLHQVGGAYFAGGIEYRRWLDELKAAAGAADTGRFRCICMEMMTHHSSTRERLGILGEFYRRTLAEVPRITAVLDIACGFNPLAVPWMPWGGDVHYQAYDIYTDLVDFLNEFFVIAKVQGQAEACDVTQFAPTRRASLAFILKSLPCIEQLDKSASVRLVEALNVDHLLISFPVQSLGGRQKGMLQNYEDWFWELLAGRSWSVRRFEFASELAFLVSR